MKYRGDFRQENPCDMQLYRGLGSELLCGSTSVRDVRLPEYNAGDHTAIVLGFVLRTQSHTSAMDVSTVQNAPEISLNAASAAPTQQDMEPQQGKALMVVQDC